MILHSYAKVNLYLRVLDKREDGFHSLITLFERIDLSDKIILTPLPGRKITLSCNRKDLACDSSNLAYRSARLLQDTFDVPRGVNIKLIKKIPIGSGMGGGSSNAASVLMGLNRLWRLRLTTRRLADLGARIGSDVPFFVYNVPFAAATGRGERIIPLDGLRKTKLYHFLAVPRLHVSTPVVYRKWDERNSFALTSSDCHDILNGVLSIRSLMRADTNVKALISALKKKQKQGLSR
ncbi:MAG: 4-(cytidine 5'-diphospho)-2-C-methyl-D-erythritol kinase, partial [Candidatus Omnitrophica bacterium]|nr:4-(cytidine 5'-diphospho)-2-C-methyl-D-erythritol kinase [Candidatus Omnitrophota bacterium]